MAQSFMDGAKKALGVGLRSILGRRMLVRMGRFLSNHGRLDLQNDMSSNGEQIIQACALKAADRTSEFLAFDIGANIGLWTESMLRISQAEKAASRIHAFEPCPGTMRTLHENLKVWGLESCVVCSDIALSSQSGTTSIYSTGDNQGRNGIYPLIDRSDQKEIRVTSETIDRYCDKNQLGHVNLVKIDTEGHDYEVMAGGESMLRKGSIDILQFEYNARWIEAKHFLKDVFDLISPLGYQLGKVTPEGVEFYSRWHFELESFREANYVAMKQCVVRHFPVVEWWNQSIPK